MKRIGENVYENSTGRLLEAVDNVDPYSPPQPSDYCEFPGSSTRAGSSRRILASSSLMLATLLAYPAIALWRHWRKLPSRHGARDRRLQIAVQFFLLLDMIVIAGAAFIFAKVDPGQLDDEFDPVLLAIYALAWLGVLGAGVAVFAAFDLWRRRVGGTLDLAPSMCSGGQRTDDRLCVCDVPYRRNDAELLKSRAHLWSSLSLKAKRPMNSVGGIGGNGPPLPCVPHYILPGGTPRAR